MRVLMLLSNAFRPDARVYDEARVLIRDGKDVRILAWDRDCKLPKKEIIEGIDVFRLRVKSTYGNPLDFISGIFRFYIKAIFSAKKMEFDVVHAHDFDTLPLGVFLSKIRGVPLVYDVHDDYGSMITESIPGFFSRVVDFFQRFLSKFPSEIIYASDAFMEIVGRKGELVLNCKDPEDYVFKKEETEHLKIVYMGIFRQKEFLTSLIEAVKSIKRYSLLLGGDGPLKNYILKRIKNEERIKYIGWVNVKKIPKYTASADVIVILNNPENRYDRKCIPVKLCEAMAAGVPLVVSKGTRAEKIVKECKCGLAIPFGDTLALKDALIKLLDNSFRKNLGKNGLIAAKRKYNEKEQMKNLLKVYNRII